jgi:hypothetical protein
MNKPDVNLAADRLRDGVLDNRPIGRVLNILNFHIFFHKERNAKKLQSLRPIPDDEDLVIINEE